MLLLQGPFSSFSASPGLYLEQWINPVNNSNRGQNYLLWWLKSDLGLYYLECFVVTFIVIKNCLPIYFGSVVPGYRIIDYFVNLTFSVIVKCFCVTFPTLNSAISIEN